MSERPARSAAECEAFLDRFLPPIAELPDEVRAALATGADPSDHASLELLGCCLWDIFSDNHDVVDAEGRVYHLGSFRGTGDFLADRMEIRYPDDPGFDYVDFYMGTCGVDGPAAVYRWIFEGLKEAGCDWIYAFPRIQLLKLGDPSRPDVALAGEDPASGSDDPPAGGTTHDPTGGTTHDPTGGTADPPAGGTGDRRGDAADDDPDARTRERSLREFAASLDRAHEEAVRKAREQPLPATVAAYRAVYGRLPEGWPHQDM